MKVSTIKCKSCGTEMPDYLERCSNCGVKLTSYQPAEKSEVVKPKRVMSQADPGNEGLEGYIYLKRHWFVTFWLWLGIVANALASILYSILLFSSIGLFSSTPEPLWLRLIWVISCLAAIGGYLLMLQWKKIGFWIVLGLHILNCLVWLPMMPEMGFFYTIITSLFPVVVLYAVLQLKQNGVSYWKSLQ